MRIEPLGGYTYGLAENFAAQLKHDLYFTHFRHTTPADMIAGDDWAAWLGIDKKMVCVAWGQIQSYPYNPKKNHVCRIGLAVLPEHRGNGYGGEMLDHVIEVAQAKYFKCVATVFADNEVSLKMFQARGFLTEGYFKREEFFNGSWQDVVSLARFFNTDIEGD